LINHGDEDFKGFASHLGKWLVNRRKRRPHVSRKIIIIEANNGDIFWYLYTLLFSDF